VPKVGVVFSWDRSDSDQRAVFALAPRCGYLWIFDTKIKEQCSGINSVKIEDAKRGIILLQKAHKDCVRLLHLSVEQLAAEVKRLSRLYAPDEIDALFQAMRECDALIPKLTKICERVANGDVSQQATDDLLLAIVAIDSSLNGFSQLVTDRTDAMIGAEPTP